MMSWAFRNKKPSIDPAWGSPMIRTRGGGTITASGNNVTVDFGIISFYENGLEYDMNTVIRLKNVPIYSYSLPIAVEGGYDISGVIFKFPEDFLGAQIPKEVTIAYWNKVEQERKERNRKELQRKEAEMMLQNKEKQEKLSTTHQDHNRTTDNKKPFVVKDHQLCCINASALPEKKSYDDSMNKFLEPLGTRKFSKRKNYEDEDVDMNIVVASLDKERRDQILSVDADEWISTDPYQGGTLNGIKISAVEVNWGLPLGKDNYKFKTWQLSQVTFR
jgi:hypothetical protein